MLLFFEGTEHKKVQIMSVICSDSARLKTNQVKEIMIYKKTLLIRVVYTEYFGRLNRFSGRQ